MKTAISIPDPVFDAAEKLAKRLSLSRSALYSTAVEQFVADHRIDNVTERLNAVYGLAPAEVDPALEQLQHQALASESW